MDIEKLIEAVRLCGSTPKVDQCKQCAYWAGGDMSRCIPNMTGDAATALSVLQAENEELRAEVEYEKEHASAYYEECGQWEAENKKLRDELEQTKLEKEALIEAVRGDCDYCKNNGNLNEKSPCWQCKGFAAKEFVTGDYWQWRGAEKG